MLMFRDLEIGSTFAFIAEDEEGDRYPWWKNSDNTATPFRRYTTGKPQAGETPFLLRWNYFDEPQNIEDLDQQVIRFSEKHR
jgi:hypothetical protein